MSEAWYRAAGAREPLTQGDLIIRMPGALLEALGPPAVDGFGGGGALARRACDRRGARPRGDDPGVRPGAREGHERGALSSLRPGGVPGRLGRRPAEQGPEPDGQSLAAVLR